MKQLVCAFNSAFEYERNLNTIQKNLDNTTNPTRLLSKLNLFDNNFKEELNHLFYKNSSVNKIESKYFRIKNLPSRQDVF